MCLFGLHPPKCCVYSYTSWTTSECGLCDQSALCRVLQHYATDWRIKPVAGTLYLYRHLISRKVRSSMWFWNVWTNLRRYVRSRRMYETWSQDVMSSDWDGCWYEAWLVSALSVVKDVPGMKGFLHSSSQICVWKRRAARTNSFCCVRSDAWCICVI